MRPDERPSLPLPTPVPLAPPEGFAARLSELGVPLDPAAITRLGDYLARLLAMNEHMNLTAITEPAAAWERHGLDSLTLVPLLAELGAGARLIDIGSGGGLPGIPLALARPDLQVTLVEATQKKAAFLSAVAGALGLTNVSVRAERAEQLATGELRGTFDAVTARAVARLSLLVPWTAPFAKPGGLVLLVKGQRADEELAEAARVLGKQRAAHEKTVATPTGKIVVLRRGAEPPKRRPRR
jgi:16S rRNA (guanine527-N7)-methyltransferase